MKVSVFSAKPYDQQFLAEANQSAGHELTFLEPRLNLETAALCAGSSCVCAFVNDRLDAPVLVELAGLGIRLVALRSAGFNHVDLAAAKDLNIAVARVPAYSPEAIAEHTVALILALARRIHRAYARVREGNFALDGLLGLDLHGRTVGIIGTGKIGMSVARIMRGFGCRLLATDVFQDPAFEGAYVGLNDLISQSDIITIHCPLTPSTHHLINADAVSRMKPGVMLINTSRGGVVDTGAVIAGLKSGAIGHLGLDVYEEEGDLFFENLSNSMIQDDIFARLLTFPNVLVTGHQAFFTENAMQAIARTTIDNINSFEQLGRASHQISTEMLA